MTLLPKIFGSWLTVLALTLCAGCAEEVVGEGPVLGLIDLDGRKVLLSDPGDAVEVFVVTNHECPIAKAYAPTLVELAAGWADEAVRFVVLHADPDLTPAKARAFHQDYAMPGIVLLDPGHAMIERLGATRTPEAIVVRRGRVLYRGRIDDLWADFGARAQQASSHDLRNAITAVLAGEPVAVPRTDVVGCLLPKPRRDD